MEKRRRVLPDWLTNLSKGNKSPQKAKREVVNKTVVNGRINVVDHVCNNETKKVADSLEDLRTDIPNCVEDKTVISVRAACVSSVRNAIDQRDQHIEISNSEDAEQLTVSSLSEPHQRDVSKVGKQSEQSSQVDSYEPQQKKEVIKNAIRSEHPSEVSDNVEPTSSSNETIKYDISTEQPDECEDSGLLSPSVVDNVSNLNVSLSTDIDELDDQTNNTATFSVAGNSVRPICKYGNKCYRKNPQHLQGFSHPGDSDYSTVDNRPECQYGTSCYRKNPLHRQHYKHTKKVQMPRKAKRPKKTNDDDDSHSNDDDDYDFDDPFINDASSDDYEPEGSDSETDFSDADTKAGSDEDVKQLQKEAKIMQRKRKL